MPLRLDALLDAITHDISEVLAKNPPVQDRNNLAADQLPDAAGQTWYRMENVVAVFVDLQGSTQLSVGKHPASTAAIYQSAMKNAVKVLHEFEADFIQVQGDGAFGLFWSDRPVERAVCAGITVRTFSERVLEPRLAQRWPDAPATGFKVGVAQGRVLVKKVGTPRNSNEQEPIWAGKPVNFAAKAAQQASRGELIVTASVWEAIEANDYLTVACNHDATDKQEIEAAATGPLWEPVSIVKLADDEPESEGHVLATVWCERCGPAFVRAVLDGKTDRAGWDVHNSRLVRWLLADLDPAEVDQRNVERLERLVAKGLLVEQ